MINRPVFRSAVLVGGVCYTSPDTFPGRKAAEQDAARLAMISLTEKIKDEVCPIPPIPPIPSVTPVHEVQFSMLKVSVWVHIFCFNIIYVLFKNLFFQISLQLFLGASSLSK